SDNVCVTPPMFRSRRASLVRRLWRHRCAGPGPEDGHGALKPAAHALFKKLKDEELELLVQAVENRGAGPSGCVWVARAEPRGTKQALPPQVLLCRLYRWPDLRHPHELKRLSCCQSFGVWGGCGEGATLCCNPHHLSRLAMPGEWDGGAGLGAHPWRTSPGGKAAPVIFGPSARAPAWLPATGSFPTLHPPSHGSRALGPAPSARPAPHLPRHGGRSPGTVAGAVLGLRAGSQHPTVTHAPGDSPRGCIPAPGEGSLYNLPPHPTPEGLHPRAREGPWVVYSFSGGSVGGSGGCSVHGLRGSLLAPADPGLAWSTTRDGCWCKLAYWEHRTRVGRLYAVHETSVNIFCELPQGSGFSLGQLQAERRSAAVRRARSKIGRGLLLSRERDGVWTYNRSEHPIFVSSPTLGPPSARGPPVHKVLPGYSLQVFDYERAGGQAGWRRPGDGPCDPNSIRISFAKGWGPCYSRQFITACPCWLEILLTKPR
uniref:Mothers against decapentaplegic homolog n=1 Tax=Chrysemys picta bellii TaxID=8478 RepID=A0A8C3IN19_CHRPI